MNGWVIFVLIYAAGGIVTMVLFAIPFGKEAHANSAEEDFEDSIIGLFFWPLVLLVGAIFLARKAVTGALSFKGRR